MRLFWRRRDLPANMAAAIQAAQEGRNDAFAALQWARAALEVAEADVRRAQTRVDDANDDLKVLRAAARASASANHGRDREVPV